LSKEEILDRWAEYVEELYDDNRVVEDTSNQVKEKYVISENEVKDVIDNLPKGKATGEDNIPAELLQCVGENGMQIMTNLINKIYNSGCIPDDFRKSIFIPIPKTTKALDCSDYRTISLISHASKILLHLIKKRITPIIERQLSESQMGFRKGKGTRDAIFQLRMIGERALKMGRKLYLCFVDYQKAFDRVKHDKLVEVMVKAGIPEIERKLIINLYWNQQASVRIEGMTSSSFSIRRGVRQGCIISPVLFNLYSEFMIREALERLKGIQFGGENLTNLRYADDAVLIADSRKKLQRMINRLNLKCIAYGMAMNVKKTKVMVMSREGNVQCNINLDGVVLEQVNRYKYLGSWITEDVRCEKEIIARIAMAKTAFWQNKELMRRNVRAQTKLKILNCYVFSVLNYGCESWTWNIATQRKIDAFECWCYRRMLKISYLDRVSNKEVLKRMHTELHFRKDMWKRKMEFAGHVLRGSSGNSHLCILEGKVCGKRTRGRPRLTWTDDIMKWTNLKNFGVIKRTAEDRDKWRTMIVNLLLEDDK